MAGICLAILVFACGLGLPDRYCHRIGPMQVFEVSDGVVVLASIDLECHRTGLIRSPAFVRDPAELHRIDLGRDGTVTRTQLKPPAGKRYLLGIDPVLRLPGDLYLLEVPSSGQPLPRLHRIDGDRVEPLSVEESGSLLRSFGYEGGGASETDRISEQNGWRMIGRQRWVQRSPDPIVSLRHEMVLRVEMGGAVDSLTAETIGEVGRRAIPLLSVRSRTWWSYWRPSQSG